MLMKWKIITRSYIQVKYLKWSNHQIFLEIKLKLKLFNLYLKTIISTILVVFNTFNVGKKPNLNAYMYVPHPY